MKKLQLFKKGGKTPKKPEKVDIASVMDRVVYGEVPTTSDIITDYDKKYDYKKEGGKWYAAQKGSKNFNIHPEDDKVWSDINTLLDEYVTKSQKGSKLKEKGMYDNLSEKMKQPSKQDLNKFSKILKALKKEGGSLDSSKPKEDFDVKAFLKKLKDKE